MDTINPRVENLLAQMTPAEKVGQMMQLDARSDLEESVVTKTAGSLLHCSPRAIARAWDLVGETRLKIPLLIGEDCIHGNSFWRGATIFPTQLGMGATWDPRLIEKVGRVTAREAAAAGTHWTFSPVVDVARDLRWGRVDETFGEDTLMIGELAGALARGYQGAGLADRDSIMATAKHFAGYSETQGGRDASEADLSHRKLRSWFLPPYQRLAEEGIGSFMLGYQTTDGIPIVLNQWLLTDVLRGEWGYRGLLVTDWDNVGRMVWEQRVQPDYMHAAAAAIKAGNDMIMTTPGFYQGALDALEAGLITEADLDEPVRHILRVKFALGLFEDPRLPDPDRIEAVVGCAEHRQVNLEVARRSLVLLRNDGLLPLVPVSVVDQVPRQIAVIGPLADNAQEQLGDWAGNSGQADWLPEGQPRDMITTVVDGLKDLAGPQWRVRYAPGAQVVQLIPDPEGEFFPDGQPRPPIATPAPPDPEQIVQAVRIAEASDVVVAVVGDVVPLVGEGKSTATLELVGGQVALLDALAATGKPMVVVLMASKPLVLPQSALSASALVWVANPGMEGGRAIAELLLGQIEPAGRLPISFPRHVGQLPIYYNQIRGQHGNRYADLTQEPQFVFGEGMSYSQVEYSDVILDEVELTEEDTLTARVQVTNLGSRPVLETVQAYVRDQVTSVSWADKELKGYRQVHLDPGKTEEVVLELPVSSFTIVDQFERRRVEPGGFELLVGPSSKESSLKVARFEVV